MHPGALVPDICHLEKIWIQSCSLTGLLKDRLMSPWGTSRHNYPVKLMLLYLFLQKPLGSIRAHEKVFHHKNYIRQALSILLYSINIHHSCDIYPAMTDEDSYSRF